MQTDWGEAERRLTEQVSVLVGENKGGYPSGNSVLVRGASETFLIDPSTTVVAKGGAPAKVDALLHSHAHEDHMCGNGLFADARVHIHDDDLVGVQTLDGLMGIYGMADKDVEAAFRKTVVEEFHFEPRPDAKAFVAAQLQMRGAQRNPGARRGASAVNVSEM